MNNDNDEVKRKKFFAEIANSYNGNIEMENLHRSNTLRILWMCIAWIAVTIACVWYKPLGEHIGKDPIWITFLGAGIIVTALITCFNVNMRHRRKVKELLVYRQHALDWKDGRYP